MSREALLNDPLTPRKGQRFRMPLREKEKTGATPIIDRALILHRSYVHKLPTKDRLAVNRFELLAAQCRYPIAWRISAKETRRP